MRQRRIEAVRGRMKALRLDAFITAKIEHVAYLTGFTGSSGVCIITTRGGWFLTDRRYAVQARQEVRSWPVIIAPVDAARTAAERRLIARTAQVGFESEHCPVSVLGNFKRAFPGRRWMPAERVIEDVAAVKDAKELALLRTAAEITDRVFEKMTGIIRPGVTERDIAAEISYWHRRYGADADAFEPIVASGPRGALPHARASEKKIRRGEMVVLDFGCRCRGYNSDMTRTVAAGNPPAAMKHIYAVVLEAQQRAIEAVADGAEGRAVDAAARAYIEANGFGKFFIHSLGHGLGIYVHEPLRLSVMGRDVLRTGNVVTVEPGIYLPGTGGVRIEDDLVVRRNGCEVLTKSPKELLIL